MCSEGKRGCHGREGKVGMLPVALEGRSGDDECHRGAGFGSGIKETTTQNCHSKPSSEEMGCPCIGEALVPGNSQLGPVVLEEMPVHGRRG